MKSSNNLNNALNVTPNDLCFIHFNDTNKTNSLHKLAALDVLIQSQLKTNLQNQAEVQELITIINNCDINPSILLSPFRYEYHDKLAIQPELLESDINHFQSHDQNNGKHSTMLHQRTINNLLLEIDLFTYNKNNDEISTNAMIDTGAVLEYMSDSFRKKHLNHLPIQPINTKVKAANGTFIEVIGLLNTKLRTQNHVFNVQFVVLKDLIHPVILGLTFGETSGMQLDLYTRDITFSNKLKVPLLTTKQLTLPAHCEACIPLTFDRQRDKLPFQFWIESSSVLRERFGIYVAKGLVDHNNLHTLIANLSNVPLTIPAGTIIAYASKLNPEWMEIENSPLNINLINQEAPISDTTDTTKSLRNKHKLDAEKSKEVLTSLDYDTSNLTSEELNAFETLISNNAHLFSKNDTELSQTGLVQHRINTADSLPLNCAPRRANPEAKKKIDSIIEEHLTKKFIRPSQSPWASPVVLASKKDGSIRFCIDYRRLNAVTIKDVYPLPRNDDCLASLTGMKYFSTFDLCSGYHQIKMSPEDRHKSAFIVDGGLFEWNVMPFGLTNAPATFQRLMDTVFAGLKWKNLLVYIDDIIVYSNSFEQHLKDLEEMFNRINNAGMTFKTSKCHLLQDTVHYLGHVITPFGIKPDPNKTKAISTMNAPNTKDRLRSFLGLCSYYRKFIPNFAKICFPLYNISKAGSHFRWGSEEDKAFHLLKSLLTSDPILCHPNYDYGFIVQTDASDEGLGAVLTQMIDGHERVIMYISRVLQDAEKKWTTREKEALAILWAIHTFRTFVIGNKFLVETDHHSLQWLMTAQKPARLVRWAMELAEYDFTIKHRSGRSNQNADALSRLLNLECSQQISSLSIENVLTQLTVEKFRHQQRQDPLLAPLIQMLEVQSVVKPKAQYHLINGLIHELRRDGTMVLLVPYTLVLDVLKLFHEGAVTAHMASDRMYAMLRKRFHWIKMHEDTVNYCRACLKCNQFKTNKQTQNGLLIPISTTKPLEIIAIDLIGPLPETEDGNLYALVCIDLFTSWVEAIPLKGITAREIIPAFFKLIISRHGCPDSVLTDGGTQFTSEVFNLLCTEFGIKHLNSSAYHQQCNGKVERFNRFLKQSLATLTNKEQTNWDLFIDRCLFVYRISLNKTLNDNPFHLIYGRDATIPYDLCFRPIERNRKIVSPDEYVAELIDTLRKAYVKLNDHKADYQNKYKLYYDRTHKEITFQIDELCMIYFPTPKVGMSKSLSPRYDGPFKIIKRLDWVTYRVQSTKPKEEKRVFVVHVQRMIRYKPFEITGPKPV